MFGIIIKTYALKSHGTSVNYEILMALFFMMFISAALFCYWFRRVEMLLHRPQEQNRVLNNDLGKGRNILSILRSMLLPALAGHAG